MQMRREVALGAFTSHWFRRMQPPNLTVQPDDGAEFPRRAARVSGLRVTGFDERSACLRQDPGALAGVLPAEGNDVSESFPRGGKDAGRSVAPKHGVTRSLPGSEA